MTINLKTPLTAAQIELLEQDCLETLDEIAKMTDFEAAHKEADDELCEFLDQLGFYEIVNRYSEIEKYY